MAEDKPKNPFEGTGSQPSPLETLAAASALGITIATQAMGFWLSVVSGLTSAARDAHAKAPESEAPRKPEPKAEAPTPRPSAEVVVLKPRQAEEKPAAKPVAEAPKPTAKATQKPAAKAPAPKPEPVKIEPVAAPVKLTSAKTPEPKPEPVKAEIVAKAEAPVAVEPKIAPAPKAKPAPAPKKAGPKPAAKKVEPKPAPAPVAAKPAAAPIAKLTPEDFRRPKAQDKPEQPDDLKKIKGLGPKLEVTLNGLGIWTYAQIAALEPAEIAWVDDYLGLSGRIERDGWIETAKAGGLHG